MKSPYSDLPPRAYWRTGVGARAPLDPGDLYRPRFPVTGQMKITTAGSCFAQHIGRTLRESGLKVVDTETLPEGISDATAQRFGYRLYSARYANIYTARQLAQLLDEAHGRFTPAEQVWRRGERFVDSQRPGVEPEGLVNAELVMAHRVGHLAAVRRAFRQADLFVFTFGLTEAWTHRQTGTVYPTAPGTIAGDYDPDVYAFHNYNAIEVFEDFERFRRRLKRVNPTVKFLITVSPVPLTATATSAHVEVASCYSKSVLRAVCGMLVDRHEDIDYFPSFEIITSQNVRGAYYEPNLRSVSSQGVQAAMGLFKSAHGIEDGEMPHASAKRRKARRGKARKSAGPTTADEVVCEEELLESFAK